jgi:two-component system, NtrC family, sensor kinase
MSLESILLFFLLRYLRRNLRDFMPDPKWERLLLQAQYVTIALFLLAIILQDDMAEQIITLLCDLAIIQCVVTGLRKFELAHVRQVLNGVIPPVLLSLIDSLLMVLWPDIYYQIENYIHILYAAAFAWMIALLILSKKQLKAYKEQQQMLAAEAERIRLEEERKAELEALVKERTRELLQQKEELKGAIEALKEAQAQLIQREKMASLGELTAGIAHEIQNPLNFVNNFSEVSRELISELREEQQNGNYDLLTEQSLLKDIELNLDKIIFHGKRADAIVKSMLEHTRTSKGEMHDTDMNALVDEYLRLSYHGMRAKNKLFNAILETHYDPNIGNLTVVSQDIGRVLLNLFNNAFQSVAQKKNELGERYQPVVCVRTSKEEENICISIRDNGLGVPEEIRNKIFQPFFTTKPAGQGTGLGLSLSYEIINAHSGNLEVETKEGEYAEFKITLPIKIKSEDV